MEFGPAQRRGERGAEGSGAAAQVDDDRSGTGEGGGLPDQELGAAAGYEDAGADGDPQAVELGPAEDVFQGSPATRRSTMAAIAASTAAVARISSASSSANTQ